MTKKVLKYVWQPDLDDYLNMGWMVVDVLYERGEYLSYLMIWPCECEVPLKETLQ